MALSFYTASKIKHASKWRALRSHGYEIGSRWIDHDTPTAQLTQDEKTLVWRMCKEDMLKCSGLIAYLEAGETPKGILVEIGMAMARGIPIVLFGKEWAGYSFATADNVQTLLYDNEMLMGVGSYVAFAHLRACAIET